MIIDPSDPPRITTKPADMVSPKEFEQVTVRCEASGYPQPKITWVKLQTNQKVGSGNTHMFHSIRRQDSGMYKCVANNGVGSPAEAFVRIKVQCKFVTLFSIKIKLKTIFLNLIISMQFYITIFPFGLISFIIYNVSTIRNLLETLCRF